MKAVVADVEVSDLLNNEVDNITYHYLDICVDDGIAFGQEKAIVVKNKNARLFKIISLNVIFEDNTNYIIVVDGMTSLPISSELKDCISKHNLIEQYRLETSRNSIYIPLKASDIWCCSCGNWNSKDICAKCGISSLKIFDSYNIDRLEKNYTERIELLNLERQKKQEEKIKMLQEIKQKIRKITKLGLPALVIIFVAIILSKCLFIPLGTYNKGVKLKNDGQYTLALETFKTIDNFKDSNSQIQECNELILKSYDYLNGTWVTNYHTSDVVDYKCDLADVSTEIKNNIPIVNISFDIEHNYIRTEFDKKYGLADNINSTTLSYRYSFSLLDFSCISNNPEEKVYSSGIELEDNKLTIKLVNSVYGSTITFEKGTEKTIKEKNNSIVYEKALTLAKNFEIAESYKLLSTIESSYKDTEKLATQMKKAIDSGYIGIWKLKQVIGNYTDTNKDSETYYYISALYEEGEIVFHSETKFVEKSKPAPDISEVMIESLKRKSNITYYLADDNTLKENSNSAQKSSFKIDNNKLTRTTDNYVGSNGFYGGANKTVKIDGLTYIYERYEKQ